MPPALRPRSKQQVKAQFPMFVVLAGMAMSFTMPRCVQKANAPVPIVLSAAGRLNLFVPSVWSQAKAKLPMEVTFGGKEMSVRWLQVQKARSGISLSFEQVFMRAKTR